MAERRVIVTGATGLVGRALCRALAERGYAVVVFSRDPAAAQRVVPDAAEYVAWQPVDDGPWAAAVDGAHAVVSLAGASIAGQRWTAAYKRTLYESRVVGTRGLVRAIERAAHRPQVLVSGSAVGYYGASLSDALLTESSPPGTDFLGRLASAWEAEALRAEALGLRVALVRTGVVLDAHAGALASMLLPFRLWVGGPILPGTQWLSWVHLADEVGLLLLALEEAQVRGPLNACAPTPQTNLAFSQALGRALGRPAWLPVPGFALRAVFGELAESLLLNGQRVIPQRALELGYQFRFPQLDAALRETVGTRG